MFYCISYPKRERKTFNGNIPDYLQKGAELLHKNGIESTAKVIKNLEARFCHFVPQ